MPGRVTLGSGGRRRSHDRGLDPFMIRRPLARLLGPRRTLVTGSALLVTLVAGLAFWTIAAAIDAFVIGPRSFGGELLHPTSRETWTRVLAAILIGALYVERRARTELGLLWFVLDEAPDGIQLADLTGRIVYSNRAVQDIYGFSPDELHGRNVNQMNVDSAVADRVILPALAQHGRWAGELQVKHKDGRDFPIWLTTSVVMGPGGRPLAAVGIIRDISARKRAEDDLRRYAGDLEEATQLKDLFADILRHDLMGPASVLRVSLDMLGKQPLDPAAARFLSQASRSSARLVDMLQNAAEYARLTSVEELEMEDLELRAVVAGVISDHDVLLGENENHVVFDAMGRYPVRASAVIADVFANLITNAIKYGPRGGTITIRIRDDGASWVVSVADEGEGIAPEDRERVFKRFERLGKQGVQGTGLGLAIAKQVVALHQGTIGVDAAPGGGALFWVSLPKR